MAKAFDKWEVHPHRPIEKLEDNLWRVEGDLPGSSGKNGSTRVMTVVKMKSGKLLIHNAIALEAELMKEIEAFGEPGFIVVPNGFHRLDCKVFKERYPSAKVVAPAGSKSKVEQVVKVDRVYEGEVEPGVSLDPLDGHKSEGVLKVEHAGGATLVLNDCLNNLPVLSGFMGFILAPTGSPAVPRIARWMFLKDGFRQQLEKLAETPKLKRVIVSHGKVISDAPAEALKTAAARL